MLEQAGKAHVLLLGFHTGATLRRERGRGRGESGRPVVGGAVKAIVHLFCSNAGETQCNVHDNVITRPYLPILGLTRLTKMRSYITDSSPRSYLNGFRHKTSADKVLKKREGLIISKHKPQNLGLITCPLTFRVELPFFFLLCHRK